MTGHKKIMVVGPLLGESKSTLILNALRSAEERGIEVVVVKEEPKGPNLGEQVIAGMVLHALTPVNLDPNLFRDLKRSEPWRTKKKDSNYRR